MGLLIVDVIFTCFVATLGLLIGINIGMEQNTLGENYSNEIYITDLREKIRLKNY